MPPVFASLPYSVVSPWLLMFCFDPLCPPLCSFWLFFPPCVLFLLLDEAEDRDGLITGVQLLTVPMLLQSLGLCR